MRKQPRNIGASSKHGLLQADHLSDEMLLEFVDDELSQKDAALAKSHLYSCWACRAHKEEISRSIAAIVEHQNAIAAPYLPPPPEDRRIFIARLDALASELGHPSSFLFPPSLVQFYEFIKARQRITLVWAVATLLLLASVPFFHQLRSPHTVSAKEFLDRASASVVNGLGDQTHLVVVQRVRVQVNGKTLSSTIYRDVAHQRVANRPSADGSVNAEVNAAILESSFDWDGLLDPEAYSRWRARQAKKADAVERVGKDYLRLKTSSSVGPVAEASLTVRTSDFHAVAESMQLRDNAQIQVAEESWDVVAITSIPPDIFAPAAPESSMESQPVLPLIPVRSEAPTDVDLTNAEVEVQAVLHDLGADLGEQIALSIRPDHVIAVDGVLADEARKRQLTDALHPLPYVRLSLLTVGEAAAQDDKQRKTTANQMARTDQNRIQLAANTPPLLESKLLTRFPDKDQRSLYVNQTLSLAQSASGRAWALNRLADQYPPRQIALLNSIERDKLHMLLTDHISALREDTSALLNQLGQVLSLTSNTPAVNASVTDPLVQSRSDRPQSSDGWQDHIRRIHSSVDVVHESISALLAGSPGSDKESVDTIELNLRTALNRLQMELQISDQQIHKTVAAPRETNR